MITLEELISLSYQGAKKVIAKKDIEVVHTLNEALEEHLRYMYTSISKFGNENPFEEPTITQKEYFSIMKRIKKLEIINGYLLDKLNETSYMDINYIDKEKKVC